MTYDEMITSLTMLNEEQGVALSALPHCSNLLHQLNKKDANKIQLFENIFTLYLKTREAPFDIYSINKYVDIMVSSINTYIDFFWPPENNPFSHQADFSSSIIPEMLCLIFRKIINSKGADLEVSAQKDLTIECIFDISNGGSIRFKNKRVDISVVKSCELAFNGTPTELSIPLIAIECKTNLDKNMISGIEHSVNELKKTFPDCKYFVISELSDFDVRKSNYASSGIDEIYILRKQKRGVIRRNPQLRKPINATLIYEIIQVLLENIDTMNVETANLNAKMKSGKLIGRSL